MNLKNKIDWRNKMNISVLGAGNGGLAIAGYLALKQHTINLYSPFTEEIKPIKKKGGIQLEGRINGFGKLNLATTDIKKAIKNAEIIMVVVPAFAHAEIAKDCAPYLQDNQIIVLNPGRTGGALEFNHLLEQEKIKAKVIVAEAQTLIYACRKTGSNSNKVLIHGIKKRVSLAALPATKTEKIIKKVQKLYPQFQAAENVLETSLDNIGAVFHPAIMLNENNPDFYDITPETAQLLERIDNERLRVADAFGIKLKSAEQWLEETYNAKGGNLYEKITNNQAYKGIKRPEGFKVRQITEDVPYGLVPIALLGKEIGVSVPSSRAIIVECCHRVGRNFWQQGRDLKKMGLSGMNIKEIKNFVSYGLKPKGGSARSWIAEGGQI